MVRTFWSSLLQQALAGGVRQAMATARQPADSQTENAAAFAANAELGFVFATGIEAGGVEDLFKQTQLFRGDRIRAVTGALGARDCALVVGGMGQKAARRATQALIDGHRPAWVISAGFAGGLSDRVAFGDIVLIRRVVNRAGESLDLKLRVDEGSAQQPRLHIGDLVTADRLVGSPAAKRELGETHQALVVDMESFAVAEVCQSNNIPCLCVRIVSDDVNQALPEYLDRLTVETSLAGKAGIVLGALARKPANLKQMYRLREESLVLADRLARFLDGISRELPLPKQQSVLESGET